MLPLLVIQERKVPWASYVNMGRREKLVGLRVYTLRVETCHRLGDGNIASFGVCTRHLRPVGETCRQCSCVIGTSLHIAYVLHGERKSVIQELPGYGTRENIKKLAVCVLVFIFVGPTKRSPIRRRAQSTSG